MIMDMRGHGDSSGTYEWTAGKVINDIKEILKLYHDYPINHVHFYGHSLGGFVTLGLQHERHTGWWKSKIPNNNIGISYDWLFPNSRRNVGQITYLSPIHA